MTPRQADAGSTVDAGGTARYAPILRRILPALDPVVDDLFLLEPHEIGELAARAPAPDLAAVLHANPRLRRFLCVRHPPVTTVLDALLAEFPGEEGAQLARAEENVVWEIADLIAYERAADYYAERSSIAWDVAAVSDVVKLDGAAALDAGAGTGRVALTLAPLVRDVFAVEPVGNLRRYLRARAADLRLRNVHVVDGFVHQIPLPDASVDVVVTSHAIGWDLPREVAEIDRVLRPGGAAVHTLTASPSPGDPVLEGLLSTGHVHGTVVGADGRIVHRFVRRRP